MDLNNRDIWPDDLLKQLERDRAVFEGWELQRIGAPGAQPVSGPDYDRALGRLRNVLNKYTLHGYHCTRLTPGEIAHIRSAGMRLPNEMVLRQRIETLRESGLVDAGTAADLIAENQAAETNRAGRIWFCFFPPCLAGESGISSLLRYWGGEALYSTSPSRFDISGWRERGLYPLVQGRRGARGESTASMTRGGGHFGLAKIGAARPARAADFPVE